MADIAISYFAAAIKIAASPPDDRAFGTTLTVNERSTHPISPR